MATNNILFVIPNVGYQSIEYSVPKKLLEQAGFHIITASNTPGTATSHDESTTSIDITLDHVNLHDYDGVVFIGGPGTLEHLDNETSYALIRSAVQANKLVVAPFAAQRGFLRVQVCLIINEQLAGTVIMLLLLSIRNIMFIMFQKMLLLMIVSLLQPDLMPHANLVNKLLHSFKSN